MTRLKKLGEEKRRAFEAKFLGQVYPVLVEGKRDQGGRLAGYTPHYIPVRMQGPDRLMESEVDIELIEHDGQIVKGVVV